MAIPAHASRCDNPLLGPQIVPQDREASVASRPSLLPDNRPRWPAVVMTITGVLSLLAGALVVIGWHTGSIVWPRALLFQSVPVRYNAGLCFVFGGISLILLTRGRMGWARAMGGGMAALGLLTFCEYLF